MTAVIDLSLIITSFLTLCISFITTVIIAPRFIPMLRSFKFGQQVRDDGPQSHLKKQGTPTMGGIIFLIAITAASIIGLVLKRRGLTEGAQLLFLMLGFGITGFLDDYLKIKKHSSDGLKPKQKLFWQLAITVVFAVWVYYMPGTGISGAVQIPFTGAVSRSIKIILPVFLFVPFELFVVLGTDNGVNFCDGLDGLCSSVTAAVAGFFLLLSAVNGHDGTAVVSAAVLGGLFGFLIFNVYPAKIFMGDTGSLALGGFVAAAAAMHGMELYIPVFGFIYMAEVISVIIQVTYFKKTGGKRFFKMAPIHHHFELLGNSETRIVAAFTIATLLLCGASFIGAVYVM